MQNVKVRFLLLIPLVLTACKRDITPPALQCDRFYSEADFRKCTIVSQNIDNRIDSPTYNPNNTAEFAYVDALGRLVKYNIHTKQEQILAEGLSRILTPDWGVSGWIAFSAGWKIWIVKSDGTRLKQLSFNPRDLNPKFAPSGDQLVYPSNMDYTNADYVENPSLRDENLIRIINVDGLVLDSFCRYFDVDQCNPWGSSAWTDHETIVAEYRPNSEERGLATYDLDGNIIDIVYEIKDKNYKAYPFIEDIEYHPTNGLIYFQDTRGIKTLDTEKGKVKLLKKSCADEFYGNFTISGDGEHIIAIKGEAWKDKENCTVHGEMYLVRMKCDGSNEERIDVP